MRNLSLNWHHLVKTFYVTPQILFDKVLLEASREFTDFECPKLSFQILATVILWWGAVADFKSKSQMLRDGSIEGKLS